MRRVILLALCILVLFGITQYVSGWPYALTQAPVLDPAQIPCGEILPTLREWKDERRLKLIQNLRSVASRCNWSDAEYDEIIHELELITENDLYEASKTPLKSKTAIPGKWFPNRVYAEQTISELGALKVINGLRLLPVEQRVREIMRRIGARDTLIDHYDFSGRFEQELVNIGSAAAPIVVVEAEKYPSHQCTWLKILGKIGDERAISFLIAGLFDRQTTHGLCRAEAAEALGNFHGDQVISALSEGLADDFFYMVDVNMVAQVTAQNVPCNVRHYLVRSKSAQALARITGKDWGSLFGEDQKTWLTWLEAGKPELFDPAALVRSGQEVDALIESVILRGCPLHSMLPPGQELDSAVSVRKLVEQLRRISPAAPSKLLMRLNEMAVDEPCLRTAQWWWASCQMQEFARPAEP